MPHQTIVPLLTKWGISPLADLVYRAMAASGPISTVQIGQMLDITEKRTRMALDELHSLGLAAPRPPSNLWHGMPPAAVLAHLEERRSRLARDRRRLAQRLASLGDRDIALDPHSARPVHGLDSAQRRLVELGRANRHETLSMHPEAAISARMVRSAAHADRSALARGIRSLTLGVPATDEDESGLHGMHLEVLGAQRRKLPSLPMRLIVFDRSTAIVRINPVDPAEGVWELTAPPVVERLVDYFLRHWEWAEKTQRGWTPPMTLSDRERAIIALLAAGHTDNTVAETLELSVRTIAYTVSALMERYEVKNRFQLGLVLGAEAERETNPVPQQEEE